MSYAKMMRRMKGRRLTKKCKMNMGFNTLGENERRKNPWLGGAWYEDGKDEARAKYIAEYHAETERLLKENPNLKLV